MNKKTAGNRSMSLLLPLTLAAGFLSLPAFGAPAPAAPSPEDAAKAATAVAAMTSCNDGTIDLLGSREGTSEQAAKFLSLAGGETMTYLKLHQACLAAIPETAKSCDRLESVKNGRMDCRDYVDYAALVSAVFGKGDARAACEQFMMPQTRAWRAKAGKTRNKDKHAKKCDFFLAAIKRGSANVCGEAETAGLFQGASLTQCKQRWIYLDAVPEHCTADPDKFDQPACREKATLLSALRTKDFRACALSPWCRALSSSKPESCDPYLVTANKLFCDQVTQAALPMVTSKRAAEAKVEAMAAKEKRKYAKGAPMKATSPEVEKAMKKIEEKKTP